MVDTMSRSSRLTKSGSGDAKAHSYEFLLASAVSYEIIEVMS